MDFKLLEEILRQIIMLQAVFEIQPEVDSFNSAFGSYDFWEN